MITFMLGYIYAEKRKCKSPIFVAVLVLICFLIFAATFKSDGSRFAYFYDAKGMLAAILITFLVVELFRVLSNSKKLLIKLPKQVPPMVATGLSYIIPVFLTLLIVSTINTGAWAIGN
jgi:PTS system cellobiose-specific IIC component